MRSAIMLARTLDPLGAAPLVTSNDWRRAVNAVTGGDWGMLGNDTAGDCTFADAGHQVMLHTANAGTIIIPTTADVLSAYSADTGYDPAQTDAQGNNPTDQGDDETAVCRFMMKTGICGQRSAGAAMVDPTNFDHIRWCVEIFGACRLGITVSDEMVTQFQDKQPWTVLGTSNPGGHDVPVVYCDADYAWVVTWAGEQPIAWSLMAQPAFLQEAHAEVYPDFVRSTGTTPRGFSLAQMLGDMQALESA
jgi:hypothetical protein